MHFLIFLTIAISLWLFGYLVGSNNPYGAAKRRLLQKGAASINKILGK